MTSPVPQTPEPTDEQLREVVAAVLADRCPTCWRLVATDEQWETVAEGERDDLCWEESICGYDAGIAEESLIVEAVRPVFARALAAAVQQERDKMLQVAEFVDDCARGRGPLTAEAYADIARRIREVSR